MHDAAPRVTPDADRRRRPAPPVGPLVGRDTEVAAIEALLADPGVRLVTITGRSGAGKTRLAQDVALRCAGTYAGGAVQLDLQGVETVALLPSHLAAALDLRHAGGADPDTALRRSLRYTPTLLLADDADAVPGAIEALMALLAAPDVSDDEPNPSLILATASAPLRLPGERVVRLAPFPVPRPAAAGPGGTARRARGAPIRAADIAGSPAVSLFCQRAAAVHTAFELNDANAGDVAALCARLDGLPLALELAAARVAALPPAAQLAMLERSGSLDLGSPRTAGPPRRGSPGRGTLRDAIAWSHRLAGEREQVLLRRMAVLGGSADLEALEAIAAVPPALAPGDVLDAVVELVDLHLVEPVHVTGGASGEPSGMAAGDARFRLLPTIAEFAADRLAAAGETERVEAAHAAHYAAVAASAGRRRRAAGLELLEQERDNLWAVLARLVARGDLARGIALAADMAPLWERHGYFPEIRAGAERLISLAAAAPAGTVPPEVHARALAWTVLLEVQWTASMDRAAVIGARIATALAIARATGDARARLWTLWAATGAVFITGDMALSAASATEGLALAQEIGDPEWLASFEYITAMTHHAAGDLPTAARLAAAAVDHAAAVDLTVAWVRAGWVLENLPADTPGMPSRRPAFTELLAVAEARGDVAAASFLRGGQAVKAAYAGDLRAAVEWSQEALRFAWRTGMWFGPALPQVALALVAGERGEQERVARLHAPVTRVEAGVMTAILYVADRYRAVVAAARAALGDAAFDRVLAEELAQGWDANLAGALAYASSLQASPSAADGGAVSDGDPTPADPTVGIERAGRAPGATASLIVEREEGFTERLTPREVEVLHELARGASNNEIADRLGLRPKTVMHHCVSIYAKLGVRGRAEATAWAFRNGLMDTERAG